MTRDEQVALLKSGVETWNKWREKDTFEVLELQGVDLREYDLRNVDLSGADLSNAELDDADFREAKLFDTNLRGARLSSAKLQGADLRQAKLQKANLFTAKLQGADLEGAKLTDANLFGAGLKGANLCAAELEGANLEATDDFTLNQTLVRGARFSAFAQDRWSVLRREYTGPKLTFHLLFLVAFFIPYMAKVLFWGAINRAQALTETAMLEQGQALGSGSEVVVNYARCLAEQCTGMPVWQVILGTDKGPLFLMLSATLIVYNLARGFLTLRVSQMREEEERTGISPAWSGAHWYRLYQPLFYAHQWFMSWVLYIAILVFLFNAWDWMSRTVWIPA